MNYKKTSRNSYLAVGVMSGTSLDGLDMVLCRFDKTVISRVTGQIDHSGENTKINLVDDHHGWTFRILGTRNIPYSGTGWPERLVSAMNSDGYKLMEVHRDFGKFIGESIKTFLGDHAGTPPDFIASHGHTIFHRPDKGITLQIGDGAEITAITGITSISDFRRLDVALGGQGAPLVPAGDELLFGQYDYCLNLGGFANISFRESEKRIAFDICPANMILNHLAHLTGQPFDEGGKIALSGKVLNTLLDKLEKLDYYHEKGPRSLGKEWFDEVFMPVVESIHVPVEDKLRTACEHIALRISGEINQGNRTRGSGTVTSVLVTGGGAKNSFLTQLTAEKVPGSKLIIPGEELIDFKEALVFAFLGLLRLRNEANCLSSVTGSARDSSGGIIHTGRQK